MLNDFSAMRKFLIIRFTDGIDKLEYAYDIELYGLTSDDILIDVEHIWIDFCRKLMISPDNENYFTIKREIFNFLYSLLKQKTYKINEYKPKLPEEVQEAMKIAEKAQDIQKYIINKQKEIQEDKRNYYKKY